MIRISCLFLFLICPSLLSQTDLAAPSFGSQTALEPRLPPGPVPSTARPQFVLEPPSSTSTAPSFGSDAALQPTLPQGRARNQPNLEPQVRTTDPAFGSDQALERDAFPQDLDSRSRFLPQSQVEDSEQADFMERAMNPRGGIFGRGTNLNRR